MSASDAAAEAKMVERVFAITPLDGRYKSRVEDLAEYFSEYSLMKYRCKVEIEYFIRMTETIPQLAEFPKDKFEALRDIYRTFGQADAMRVKKIEGVTNHDVKAVEYYLKEEYKTLGLPADCMEFIHFGLTSQDVNNTAVPLALKDAIDNCYLPVLTQIKEKLLAVAHEWDRYPMLARTHGQPASPTTMGKEIMVFADRIDYQTKSLMAYEHSAKFGGATGNFNAHLVAYPDIDWRVFADHFIKGLGLRRQQYTTQIEHYDGLASVFQNMSRINTILIDLCRDMWQYVSMTYFTQTVIATEVGSSAMPHKVNPIDFENAEGNFGLANALFTHLAQKLPISRLQRDLTDSTVSRTFGMPVGHTLLAFKSLLKALGKMNINDTSLRNDLESNWAVVAEAIQTVLRREAYPAPYEALKALTRTGKKIDGEVIAAFIDGLEVTAELKAELKLITPHNYTGYGIAS